MYTKELNIVPNDIYFTLAYCALMLFTVKNEALSQPSNVHYFKISKPYFSDDKAISVFRIKCIFIYYKSFYVMYYVATRPCNYYQIAVNSKCIVCRNVIRSKM